MNSIERWSLLLAAVVAIILAVLPGAKSTVSTAPPFWCKHCGWSGHWPGTRCPECGK